MGEMGRQRLLPLIASITVLGIVLVISASVAIASASDWQQFQKDKVNIGWTTDHAPVAGPNEKAHQYLEGCGWSGIDVTPIVADDVGGNPDLDLVYVHTCGGNIWACWKNNGSVKWSKTTSVGGFPFQVGNPTYGNNKIYVPTNNGHLFIFNAATGAQLNNIAVCDGYQLNTPVTYYNGRVFFGDWNGPKKYYCYWENGTECWNRSSTSGGGYYWAGAAVIGDYLVYGDDKSNLTSVYWCNGTTADEINVSAVYGVTANEIRSSITWNETYERIYFTSKGGYCYALGFDESTGTFNTADKWCTNIGYSTSTPAVYNGRVYVGYNNGFSSGKLYCLNENNGNEIWNVSIGPVQASPALSIQGSDVYIYVTTNCANGRLYCIKDNGGTYEQKWSYITHEAGGSGGYILQGVAISNGSLYFGNDGGYLYIINEKLTKPDLTVTAINNSTIYNGTYNIITATVENVGNGSAGTFNVTLNDGSGVVDDVSVGGLNAGEQTQVKLLWTPTTTNSYTLTVTADSGGVIDEWNEGNNTMQKTLTPIGIPATDLVVSEVCDGNLINGTANEVFAVIRNDGANASGFNVSLEVNGVEVDKAFVPMLHFRAAQLVALHWTPTSVGSVQLNVTVDSDGQIAESDELNNMTSQNVNVVSRVTVTVNPGGSGSIQNAITSAANDTIILVNDGTYNERITIPASKSGIKLIANGSDVVICSNTAGDIVTVEGNYCKVKGFKINSSWGGSIYPNFPGAGINVSSDWNVIADNYIYNTSCGIKLYGSNNLIERNIVGNSSAGQACLNLMAISGNCNAIVKNRFDGDTGYGWILSGIFTSSGITETEYEARGNLLRDNNFTVASVSGAAVGEPGNLIFSGCRNLVFNNIINDTSNKVQLGRLNWYFVDKVAVEDPKCGNVVHGPFYGGNFWLNYMGTDSNNDLLGDTGVPHMGYDYHPLIKAKCGDVNCDDEITIADAQTVYNALGGGELCNRWAADVNCDDEITIADAQTVYNALGGGELNCCKCECSG